MSEVVLIVFLVLYSVLAIMMIIGGVKMCRKLKNDEFTAYQQGRLRAVSNDRSRYERLKTWYRGLNAEGVTGKVLDLKGRVVHPGFRVVDGTSDNRR